MRDGDCHICPVMEGDSTTLMCTVPYSSDSTSTSKLLFWNREVDNNRVVVITCDIENNRCLPSNSHYTSILTSVDTSSATSSLTISSAERIDQGSWTCSNPSSNMKVAVCNVKVFDGQWAWTFADFHAKPISVSCGQPKLQSDSVKVTCTGEKIYPEPLCLFSWIRNGTEVAIDQAVVNQFLSQQGSPSYFYSRCTWTVPAQSLGFGSHQFKVLIYPNVTGTNDDRNYTTSSNLTSPVNVINPDVVLEGCPEDFVQEGTTVSCTCKEKNNLFLLADVTWSGGSGAPVVGKQNSDLTFQAAKNSPNYSCQAEILGSKSASILYVPKVAFPPTITSYTVSGSTNLTVHNNTDVMFSCEAEGNPSPDLFLLRDSYSNKLGNIDSNNQVTFKFNKTMTCQDTGVYVCQAQTPKAEVNKSVDINVLCKQQLEHSESQNRVYRQCINQRLDFGIAITGFPQPTLQLRSDRYVLGDDDYLLTYSKLKGSSGIVFIRFFSISSTYFQNYSLDITNSEGTFIYNFQILECEKINTDQRSGTGVNVGAVVGGIIAGIVVIILVALLFVIARRKGFLEKNVKNRNADYNIQTLPFNTQKETEQEDLHPTPPRATEKSKPDKGLNYENTVPDLDKEDVPPYSHYKELADSSSDYVNKRLSDTQDNVMQYENTASAL